MRKATYRKITNLVLVGFGLLTIVMGYQNCTGRINNPVNYAAAVQSPSGGGNGDGYDYKPNPGTYYRIVPEFKCGGSARVYSSITVTQTSMIRSTVETNHCTEVKTEIPLRSVEYAPFNEAFLGFQEGIYHFEPSTPDLQQPRPMAESWCHSLKVGSTRPVVDVVMSEDPLTHKMTATLRSVNLGAAKEVLSEKSVAIPAARELAGSVLSYSGKDFKLVLDTGAAAGAQPNSSGRLTASVMGQSFDEPLSCRTGHWLDIKAPAPLMLALDFTSGNWPQSLLSFSRSSVATVYDSSGRLVVAPADSPRLDYNPVTLQPNGLLMERSSTNLAIYSEEIEMPAWMRSHSTVAADTAVSPDGTQTADFVAEDTGTGWHSVQQVQTGYSVGQPVACSVYVKPKERSLVALLNQDNVNTANANQVVFDLAAGTSVAASDQGTATGTQGGIQSVGNGWYRIWVSGVPTTTPGDTTIGGCLVSLYQSPGVWNYAGDGTSGLYVWGAQLESGSAVTSYIPTLDVPVTRAADSLKFTSLSWFNSAAGTLFADFVNLGREADGLYSLFGFFRTQDGSFNQDSILLADQGLNNSSSVTSNGTTLFSPGGSLNPSGSENKMALGYSSADFAYTGNGEVPTVTSSSSSPAGGMAYSYVGSQPDGRVRNRYIRQVQYFGSRLSDETLQQLSR